MKQSRFIVAALSMSCITTLSSCFKEEPLNAECDIEQAYIHAENPHEIFLHASDTLVNVLPSEMEIHFKVKLGIDRTALSPFFKITQGATIVPKSGSTFDFSDAPVTYTVTSEDNQWTRTYKVFVDEDVRTIGETINFDFERFHLNEAAVLADKDRYYVWSDLNTNNKEMNNWASGNEGFAISMPDAVPYDFPTTPTEGFDGKGVKLTTKSTGEIGASMNMPIAAGNLFIGKFNGTAALMDAMSATQFGLPFDRKPIKFSGYYKYTPGAKYQDKNQKPVDKTDEASIYAVLYKNHDIKGNVILLDGNSIDETKKLNPNIVARAQLAKVSPTSNWTLFDIPFDYREDIDLDLLERSGYSLAIVFSSSADGAKFCGAIGSTLCIDKVRIVCEKTDNNVE